MPFSSCRPSAGLPRSCCRLLRLPGGAAGGSSRGTDGVALGRGAIPLTAPIPFGGHRLRPQISLFLFILCTPIKILSSCVCLRSCLMGVLCCHHIG